MSSHGSPLPTLTGGVDMAFLPRTLVRIQQRSEMIPERLCDLQHRGDLLPARQHRPSVLVQRPRDLIEVSPDGRQLIDGLSQSYVLRLREWRSAAQMRAQR